MRLAEAASVLAEHRQFLPLAVPFIRQTTIGGTIAGGVDSPLRQSFGTARDFVLGMEFVTGEGIAAKSGGRVVKNVTGYDIHKLMIGALGTLGIITRINFRTFPLPAESRAFVARFADSQQCVEMRHRVAQSPLAPLTMEIFSPRWRNFLAARLPRARPKSAGAGFALDDAMGVHMRLRGQRSGAGALRARFAAMAEQCGPRASNVSPRTKSPAQSAASGNLFRSRWNLRPRPRF